MTEQAVLIAVLAMIVAVYVVPMIMLLSWSIPHREAEEWHTIGYVLYEQAKHELDRTQSAEGLASSDDRLQAPVA